MLTVLGLGTGGFSSLTMGGYERISHAEHVILQTGQIPVARELEKHGISFVTLDVFYEEAQDFDDWAEKACSYIRAQTNPLLCLLGDVYANALLPKLWKTGAMEVVPGMGFFESALSYCAGRLSCGHALVCAAPQFLQSDFTGQSAAVITEVDSAYQAADIAVKLGRFYPADSIVYVVEEGQTEETCLKTLPLREKWGYAVCIVVDAATFSTKECYSFADLCHIISRLRGEHGCPWDKKQTHESLRASLIEECYETVDAIDAHDPHMLADELGDVLMQVVMHAAIADEHAAFDIIDVCDAISKKMIRRHPHIFGNATADTAEEVIANWEEIKRSEKSIKTYKQSLLDIPKTTSPLIRAEKLQKKASLIGFDWKEYAGALAKVKEELVELEQEIACSGKIEEEAGDLLFAAVNLLRLLGVDADVALNAACAKFITRFSYMEDAARAAGCDLAKLSLSEQEKLWQQAKHEK